MGFTPTDLENALEALGTLLASRGHTAEIAVIGGGSLLLMGLIQRATKDLDVVAVVEQGVMRRGEPLPAPVVEAVEDVARAMGLANVRDDARASACRVGEEL
jgi:predicted Rossmann-fold nucleotide-binding protein